MSQHRNLFKQRQHRKHVLPDSDEYKKVGNVDCEWRNLLIVRVICGSIDPSVPPPSLGPISSIPSAVSAQRRLAFA